MRGLIQVSAQGDRAVSNHGMSSVPADPSPAGAVEVFDLRHLPAPEPMVRILDALSRLPDGHTLIARTPCRPVPLLERLAAMGYRTRVVVAPGGDAWVHITADDGSARA
jgi:hypothetical protein